MILFMNEVKIHKYLPCDETPDNCNFLLKDYRIGDTFNNVHKEMNYLIFCREGEVHLTSSLFFEETLYGGEIMFLPRMADCQGEMWKETHVVVHTFNNTVCRPENCILRYLYTHAREKNDGKSSGYYCKLVAHKVIMTFMESISYYLTTASGSCSKEELMERGFSGCLLKPFSISELMEVSDKCAMKGNRNEKPDFTSLLSYGNEAVMLDKLIAETEKEMQAIREAGLKKDLQELDALTHHLRSLWEILRADQPLRELYKLLHSKGTSNNEAIHNAVKSVLDKGSEIIRLAKEERRKYNNG